MKFLFAVILSWCAFAEGVDDMHFTCRSRAGCEVFEVCTRQAMTRLQEQVVELINSKLELEKQQKALLSVKAASRTSYATDEDLEELWSNARDEFERRTVEVHSEVNDSITDMAKEIDERITQGEAELRAFLEDELKEGETRVSSSLEEAQLETVEARRKEIEKLKEETKEMLISQFNDLSQRWNDGLEDTKNGLTATFNEALSAMDNKVQQISEKVDKMWRNFKETMDSMSDDLESRLQNVKGRTDEITRDEIQKMIEANLKEASFGWGSYYENLDSYDEGSANEDVKHNISVTRQGVCKVSYDEKCFWIVEPELAVSYHSGADECVRRGGGVANIYSKTHLDLLKVYMRSLISPTRMYIDVWTGMTIDPQTEEVFYTNGSLATFLEWEPGSPAVGRSFLSWSSIYVIAKKHPKSVDQGMVNSSPDSIRDGVLCEL